MAFHCGVLPPQFGSDEHVQETWTKRSVCPYFHKHGQVQKRSRWFQWHEFVPELEEWGPCILMVMLGYCIECKMYKNIVDTPLYRPDGAVEADDDDECAYEMS